MRRENEGRREKKQKKKERKGRRKRKKERGKGEGEKERDGNRWACLILLYKRDLKTRNRLTVIAASPTHTTTSRLPL